MSKARCMDRANLFTHLGFSPLSQHERGLTELKSALKYVHKYSFLFSSTNPTSFKQRLQFKNAPK
jgi:hypothetical protein